MLRRRRLAISSPLSGLGGELGGGAKFHLHRRLGNTAAAARKYKRGFAGEGCGRRGRGRRRGPRRRAASVRGPTVGWVAGRPVHADGDGQRWPRVDRLVLRGVVPGEPGLRWGPGGCKGCRGGGKPERDEQPVRVAGVSDE